MNELNSWKLAFFCWYELVWYYIKKYALRNISAEDELTRSFIRLLAKASYNRGALTGLNFSEVNFWIWTILSTSKPEEGDFDKALEGMRNNILKDYLKERYIKKTDDHYGDVEYWLSIMKGQDYTVENIISKGIYHSEIARYRVKEVAETQYLNLPVEALKKAEQQKKRAGTKR